MACKYICDGCGKEAPAIMGRYEFFKPRSWFHRVDEDGIQVACSRECIDRIAEKSGKTSVVIPI